MADGQVEVDILGNTSDFDKAVDGLTDTVSAKTIALGNVLADLAKKAISSLAGAVSDAIDTGMSFEKSMSNVAALQQAAGATADDIALLKQAAEEYGASTQFTMTACSDALGFMALAGWDAQKSIEALPGVLNLAAAADMDLAKASDMVTDYMSAFSKSVNDFTGEALTAAEFSDKLAYAQANSNTSALQLGEAFKNCAANLNAAGQQMDTVTAILGKMADQGKKGSEAGTALSAIMRDLTNAMDDGTISINGTRIAIAKEGGDYRDLIDIMEDIESATNGLGETERAAALSAAFTSDSIAGLNLVLNAGTEEVRKLEAGLSDCEGAAEAMAATLNDNLKGDITYMQSAMDAVKNSIFEGINPALRSLVQTITNDVAPNLNMLVKGLVGVAGGVASAGNLIHDSVAAMGDVLKNTMLDALSRLPDVFKAGLRFRDAFVEALADLLPALLPALTETIYEMSRHLIAGIPLMVQAATELVNGIADALLEIDFAGMLTDLIGIMVSRLKSSAHILVQAVIALSGSIIDALPAMLEGGQQIMDALLNGITELLPALLPLGLQLLEAICNGLLSAVPQLAEAAQQILASLAGFVQDNIPLIAETAIAVLNILADSLVQNVPLLMECAKRLLTSLIGFVQQYLPLLITVSLDLLNTLLQMLIENLPMLAEAALSMVEFLIGQLLENLPLLLTGAVGLLNALVGMIVENLPLLVSAAVDILLMLTQALVGSLPLLLDAALLLLLGLCQFLTDNLGPLVDAAFEIVDALTSAIAELAPMLYDCAIALIQKLSEFITDDENRGLLIDCAEAILQALIDGLGASAAAIWTGLEKIRDEMWEWFRSVDWLQLGKDIMNGIAAGLSAGVVRVGDMISDAGEAIVNGFKDFFGIHSPSRLMRDEIGKFLLPGVSVGVDDTSAETAADINSALDGLMDSVATEDVQVKLNTEVQAGNTVDATGILDGILNSIDTDIVQMRLRTAVQMQGFAAIPPDFAKNIRKETDRPEEPAAPTDPTGWEGDMIFNVSFGSEPFDRMVISAIDRQNAISGGVDV